MVWINPSVLVYLVQVVDEKMQALQREVASRDADDAELPDYEEELFACGEVAVELERCYREARQTIGNMPEYSDLARQTS